MGARPMDSEQAWFSLPTASVGPSPRSLDDDPWRLGALKAYRPSKCSTAPFRPSATVAPQGQC